MLLLLSTSCFFSMFFALLFTSTPLNLGLWIMFISILMASTLSFLTTSWFGLLLFIIYVGGLLVMFAYFVAISPNQEISFRNVFLVFAATFMAITMLSPISIPQQFAPIFTASSQMAFFFYAPLNIAPLILMALTLFLALVAVVKVSNRGGGPLRPFS
uniref:NADH dehydrogenase subunit 6 n=1 Tax=Pharyngocirrus uchidai TaxID=2498818 RepID=A0A7G9IX06_9ANNE|nr:NADH dehydrogenase subunit 6 [Pharyngocirrus uchidai]QNM39900.1 NADH dehydrogenase subunit 6 [Pharyngocirrus uchidai]